MLRGIKELGDSMRCKKCNKFAKMIGLRVSEKVSKASYICEDCVRNSKEDYTTEEFIAMANGMLIDDKWIHDFQRKYMIGQGEFIKLKGGLDGAHFSTNKDLVNTVGKKLICKCGEFYKIGFQGHKKDILHFVLVCQECGNKKLKMKKKSFFGLGLAGLIPTSIITHVKDELESDDAPWDSSDSYSTPATVLSTDARSRLGMDEDDSFEELEGLLCPNCRAAISIEMKKFGKCPTCGSPLEK